MNEATAVFEGRVVGVQGTQRVVTGMEPTLTRTRARNHTMIDFKGKREGRKGAPEGCAVMLPSAEYENVEETEEPKDDELKGRVGRAKVMVQGDVTEYFVAYCRPERAGPQHDPLNENNLVLDTGEGGGDGRARHADSHG